MDMTTGNYSVYKSTVMSHESCAVRNLGISIFCQTVCPNNSKVKTALDITGPLWGESTGSGHKMYASEKVFL